MQTHPDASAIAKQDDPEDFFSPELFLNESYVHASFSFGDVQLKVKLSNAASTDFDLTGQVVWPAAEVLCKYVQHIACTGIEGDFQNKISLELGAGVGLCGLLLSNYCKHTVLTDHSEVVMNILQDNISLNVSALENRVSSLQLTWGENLDRVLTQFPNKFDIILGSDVVFWKESIPALLRTAKELLSEHLHSRFILSYLQRSTSSERFLLEQACTYGFRWKEVNLNDFLHHEEMTSSRFQFIRLLVFTHDDANK